MTTASIGKGLVAAGRACIVVVSQNSTSQLGAIVTRAGHDLIELESWESLATAAHADLLLFTEDMAPGKPEQLDIPSLLVADRSDHSAPGFSPLSPRVVEAALDTVVGLAVELHRKARIAKDLETLVSGLRDGSALVGRSPAIRRLQGMVSRAADSDATVLIEGPPGAGKSLAARMIHCKSRRSQQPIRCVDCGAVTAETLTSVLQDARQTTLVLENVDKLPAAAQSVLVRQLKDSSARKPRIVATTAAHLPELVARGAFREDLYYRLHSFPMVVPSLRERREDISMIADVVLVAHGQGRSAAVAPAALAILESLPWPGNVAQLEAVLCRAQALAGGQSIEREHILTSTADPKAAVDRGEAAKAPLETELGENDIRPFEVEEQFLLSRALRATKGNVRRAAQLLGIGRATLYRKIQQYQLRLQ